jgi:hypothetical protein
VAEVEEL